MTCSAGGRIGGALHAIKNILGLCKQMRLQLCLFNLLAVAGITSSFLWPAQASADTSIPFSLALNQSSQVDDFDRHEARIADLESRTTLDSYFPELGEAYLDLAGSLAARNRHAEALDAYSRALQLVRVTEGLNSLNQLPILEAQLETLEQTHQWDRYDETLNLIVTISQDRLPAGDDRRVEALNQLSKWNLRATEEALLEYLSLDSGKLVELFEQELGQIEQAGTANVSDFAVSSLQLGEAYARLAQARHTISKPIAEYRSITSRPTMDRTPCPTSGRGTRGGPQACMAAARPNLAYWRVPQRKKDQEVRSQLEALRLTILGAAETLEERNEFPGRELLVEEFRFLAESFTAIVSR